MIQPTLWNGKDLSGVWQVTLKIDGVQARWNPNSPGWRSRADKPLYNIPEPLDPKAYCVVEVYLGTLRDTVRAVRTQHLKPDTPKVERHHLYTLEEPLDWRLNQGLVGTAHTGLSAMFIRSLLQGANKGGFEGLVLRQGDKWLKVKPKDGTDCLVTGYKEGTGKDAGSLGAVNTKYGWVGSGFSRAERKAFWARREVDLIGMTIEAEFMQKTPDGKFRHSRFIRERFDKEATK